MSNNGLFIIQGETLTNIADAIREKTDLQDKIALEDFPNQIRNIEGSKKIEFTQSNITSGNFRSVLHNNGVWVVYGKSGVYYSTDGKTWTQSNITDDKFKNVSYNNGIWVAEGNNNDVGYYYSTDGKIWTQSNITSGYTTTIKYGGGIWVIIDRSSNGAVCYSTDGKTWTQSNITSWTFFKFEYLNGLWIGYSNYKTNYNATTNPGLYYSTDGKTWTQSNITRGYIQSVGYADGMWVCGYMEDSGNIDYFYYSTDGKTWTQSTAADINTDVSNGFCRINGIWTCGSYHSTDGREWIKSNTPTSYFSFYNSNDPYRINGIYIKYPAYSTDFTEWIAIDISDAEDMIGCKLDYSSELKCYNNNNDNGIVHFAFYDTYSLKSCILYTTDGIVFKPCILCGGYIDQSLSDIGSMQCNNGIYIAGNGLYSTDGITFERLNINLGGIPYIKYSDGIWVVVNDYTDIGIVYFDSRGIE